MEFGCELEYLVEDKLDLIFTELRINPQDFSHKS